MQKLWHVQQMRIVANANGEHLDEALEVLDYIGDGGDWLKTVTNSYGGFMACMDIEADDEIASKDYYKDLKAYMDAGKVRSTLWNQLPSGASDVLGDDVQGYFAGITDEDQTLDALDEGFKKACRRINTQENRRTFKSPPAIYGGRKHVGHFIQKTEKNIISFLCCRHCVFILLRWQDR